MVTHALTAEGHDASEGGTGRGTPLVVAPVFSFSAGNSADAYGIAATEECSPPLRAAESGTNQVPSMAQGMSVRRLTPTECERLQGFPDGWTDGQSDSARYRQLGNAVCVNVAEWIGRRIMQAN